MPASMSAAPSSSPSASPGWSAGSAGYLWISRYVDRLGRGRQRLRAQHHRRLRDRRHLDRRRRRFASAGTCSARCSSASSDTRCRWCNISPFWQMAISGSAIILAVVAQRARRAQPGPHHPEEGGGRMSATDAGHRRTAATFPTGSTRRCGRADALGGAADRRRRRDLRRQQLRLALFPRSVVALRPHLQFHREGDDRAGHGAADHRRRDRPFGGGDRGAGVDGDGHGDAGSAPARRCWSPSASASGCLRRLQRRPGHLARVCRRSS